MRAVRLSGGSLAARRIGAEPVDQSELERWRDTPVTMDRLPARKDDGEAKETSQILIVEDNPADRLLTRLHLVGSDIKMVDSIARASEILSVEPNRCVLLDLNLPDAHGLEGLIRLRGVAPTTPIIVLTGHEDEAIGLSAISAGAQDYLRKGQVDREHLLRSIRFARQRAELWSERERAMLEDPLTRLPGRQLIIDRLRHALNGLDREGGGSLACLFIDLDGFKSINDEHGHAAGDHVLTAVGDRLRRAVRPTDSAGRYGGDEFLVVCPGVEAGPVLAAIAQRLAAAIAEPIVVRDQLLGVRASIGAAVADRPGLLVREVIEQADAAMYDAKASK